VKGLAIKDKKTCCAVSTLLSMAYRLKHLNGIVCAVMDARCNQVYNALFKCENGEITRLTEDRALMMNELVEELENHKESAVYVIGDGADLFFEKAKNLENVFKTCETLKYQHAEGVALAAAAMIKENNTVSPETLLPFYLRLPQAERELKDKGRDFTI
jgi:tRNA threonylcarbamoyladenosine biosynthesis protein TsaB